jgi:hypothetical protein
MKLALTQTMVLQQLLPTGGTAPYTYLWQSGGQTTIAVNSLASGTHTVTVTDARGCSTTAFAVITEPALLTSTFGSQTNVSCLGGANGSVTATWNGRNRRLYIQLDARKY